MKEYRSLSLLCCSLLLVLLLVVTWVTAPSIARSPLGETATLTSAYRLFATSANLGIVELDSGTGAVRNSFAAPVNQGVSDGLAYDGSTLYYLSGRWESNTLYALNPDTGAVRATYSLPASAFRNGLAALDGLVYLLDWSILTQDITVFDPASGSVVGTLDIDGTNPGAPQISGGLAGLTGPDGLIVTTASTGEVLEIDPATGLIVGQFAHGQGDGALGAAVVAGQIYLGWNTSPTLQIYERDGTPAGSVTVPGSVGIQSLGGDDFYAIDIVKTVEPVGLVQPGDLLTYTLVLSTAPGAELGVYDPLSGTAFVRFVPPPPAGLSHTAGALTGSLLVTPGPQIEVGFVVQVAGGGAAEVINRGCVYPQHQTVGACRWSNEVTNEVLQPPGIPVLLAPPDGTLTTTQALTFTWQAGPGPAAEGYNFQLDGEIVTTTGTFHFGLVPTGTHAWTVRALNPAGYSNWAESFVLEVQEMADIYRLYLPLVLR